MDRARFLIAILLSALVLIGWPLISHYFLPNEEQPPAITQPAIPDSADLQSKAQPSPTSADQANQKPAAVAPQKAQAGKPNQPAAAAPAVTVTTVPERVITISSDYWTAKLSNHGAVNTSWIISKERLPDGTIRSLTAADGGELQLVPQDDASKGIRPFSLRLPGSDDLAAQLNQVNYQVEGIDPSQNEVDLGNNDSVRLTFTYSSPQAIVHKTFTFYGGRLVFDASADVKVGDSVAPVEFVIGPRIGDQSDKATGTYSEPPQIVDCQADEKVSRLRTNDITPPFGKVNAVDEAGKRIEIDKPLAGDVNQVKLLASDGKSSLGYAKVLDRDLGSRLLTLDSLPPGTLAGCRVAQGTDTLRRPFRWAGATDHYFAMIAVPDLPVGEITVSDFSVKTDDQAQPIKDYPTVAIPVGATGRMRVFVGPKDRHILGQVSSEVGTSLESLIQYGTFSFLVRPLAPLVGTAFNLGDRLVHNYGWSIVLVTVLINLLLLPLRTHSSKKMKSAAKHQPRIKELQEKMKKLKESPKKNEREIEQVQREQMELMKEANPLGGCLPMILQMPIFWSIYLFLEVSLDVRHQPWIFWIKDLSTPDPYKILPIIMCVSMIGSSMLQPQPGAGDPSQKMQRMMMTWMMPIFLTWLFFFSAPSGLVLYWMVSNLAGVGLQFAINKWTAEQKPEAALVSGGKGKPGAGINSDGTLREKAAKTGDPKRKGKVGEKEVVGGVK
jgi:YidC/Oxa1 family membrane protein insertase